MQPASPLSGRQIECILLVGEGLTSKEIAQRLSISPHTVDQHIKTAIRLLSVNSRAAAVAALHRRDPSPESGSLPPSLAEPPKSELFPEPGDWPVQSERIGGAGAAVRETVVPFLEHPALALEEDRIGVGLTLWQKIMVVVVLAIVFPILMIGLIVFAREAYNSPFG